MSSRFLSLFAFFLVLFTPLSSFANKHVNENKFGRTSISEEMKQDDLNYYPRRRNNLEDQLSRVVKAMKKNYDRVVAIDLELAQPPALPPVGGGPYRAASVERGLSQHGLLKERADLLERTKDLFEDFLKEILVLRNIEIMDGKAFRKHDFFYRHQGSREKDRTAIGVLFGLLATMSTIVAGTTLANHFTLLQLVLGVLGVSGVGTAGMQAVFYLDQRQDGIGAAPPLELLVRFANKLDAAIQSAVMKLPEGSARENAYFELASPFPGRIASFIRDEMMIPDNAGDACAKAINALPGPKGPDLRLTPGAENAKNALLP